MTPGNYELWQQLSPYLDEMLDLPEEQREAWLAAFAERNPTHAASMRSLLEEHQALAAKGFLEEAPFELPLPAPHAGQQAGAYTLLSQIGQGGMGTVWLAERNDGRFKRQAAIKFLNIQLGGRCEERFRREGNVLGQLSHPNIAELLDAGINTDRQAFLILEYVDGDHIDKYCDEHSLGVEERIRLFLDVLAAVAHAHANLIVHRDIKSSNVLVGKQGKAKLLDFGIAKWIEEEGRSGDKSMLTREGEMALTPTTASPEQMKGEPVTVATDVYMLGNLLYLLLTKQMPIGAGPHSSASLVYSIVFTEPPLMSAAALRSDWQRTLRGDLDTIAAKALKKAPSERYASVSAMADDLRRYLKHQPIAARPDSASYRAAKFVRRNRALVAIGSLAVMAIFAGLIGTVTQARRANDERDFAWRQVARAEAISDLNSFVLSDAAPGGKPFTVTDLLGQAEQIVARQNGTESGSRVDLLVSIGRQYWSLDQDAKARRALEEAYKLSLGQAEPSPRASAACALASSLARAGEHPRAKALLAEGIGALPAGPQFILDRIFCLLRSSEVARSEGGSRAAIARIEEAREVMRQSPFQSDLLQLRVSMDLAEAYRVAGQHREASEAFARASSLLASLGRDNTQTAGTLYNNWALALSQLGVPLEAEKIFRRAIEISSDGNDERAVSAMLMVNYARVLRELNRSPEAEGFAERAYTKALAANQIVVVNQALLLRSTIYRERGKLELASEMLNEVEPRLQRALPGAHIAFASIASERALIAEAFDDLSKAHEFANQALTIAQASVRAGGQGADYIPVLLLRRSKLRLLDHRVAEAVEDATKGLSLLKQAASPDTFSSILGRAYLTTARALSAQGKAAEASAAIRTAVQHLEKALGPEHADTLAAKSLASLASTTQ